MPPKQSKTKALTRSQQSAVTLGLTALQQGDFAAALKHLQQAIAQDPNQADVQTHLGVVHFRLGNLEAGIAAYETAVALQPSAIESRYNLAIGLQKLNRMAESIEQLSLLLAQHPTCTAARYQLGNALQRQQQFSEAIVQYRLALQGPPSTLDPLPVHQERIWYNLGVALQALSELDAAQEAYQQALALQPQYAEAYNAIGSLFQQRRQFDQALVHYQQASQLLPDYLPLLVNLGNMQVLRQQWQAAEATFRRLLQIDPNNLRGIDGLLKVLLQTCQWTEIEELTDRLWQAGQQISRNITLYSTMFLPLSAAQRQVLAENHAKAIAQQVAHLRPSLNFAFSTAAKMRIRLGYVSGDYRNQAMGHLCLRLFEQHDRQQFEVFAYSLGPNDGSDCRKHYEATSDCFREVYGRSAQAIAQQIYDDGIDILIDLEGHTEFAQLEIYALKPAPLIVTYLGHPGTMGGGAIDYILTDSVITPPDQTQWLSERAIVLPPSFFPGKSFQQPIAPVIASASRAETRVGCGLPPEAFVFCAFHKTQKYEPTLFAVWLRLLRQIPHSVLWLMSPPPEAIQQLRAIAEQADVAGDRLIFADPVPFADYLKQLQCADLFLDARYHSAAATAVDVLSVGLPLLTLAGEAPSSRLAASLLTAAGLPELIAHRLEDYEQRALHLATRPAELQALRQRLIEARSTRDLFSGDRTVRHLEAAYSRIWQIYQAGQPPQEVILDRSVQPTPIDSSRFDRPLMETQSAESQRFVITESAETNGAETNSAEVNSTKTNGTSAPALPFTYCLSNLLTAAELDLICSKLAAAEFRDGKPTAGRYAEAVKQNLQLAGGALSQELGTIVAQALARHEFFYQAVRPKLIRPPLFSRYDAGMAYGAHIDSPIMNEGAPMRSDVSLTLFLSDPATYTGGELVLVEPQGEYPFKLAAGAAVLYPSTSLHRVAPVTQGTRLVAVTWVQSLVRDASDRALLLDLETARLSIFEKYGKTPEFDLISKSHANLMRKWIEV